MQLTNADVDQWLADLSETVPARSVGNRELSGRTVDLVRALALEACHPDYVFQAAKALFSEQMSVEPPQHRWRA